VSKLEIIVASTRPGRVGLPVAKWLEVEAKAQGGFDEVEIVDLAEVNLPFFNEPKHPRMGEYEHQHTKDWSAKVAEADAFVLVMPEYNHGFNAVLKNALDYLAREWHYKAVGLASYGGIAAGTRAAQMIKPVLGALRMTAVTEAVSIPMVQQFLSGGEIVPNDVLSASAKAMLNELAQVTEALKPLRKES
jgi:NAD(P)H-dependent FMN reductase